MRISTPFLPLSLVLTITAAFPLLTPYEAYHNLLPRSPPLEPRASYSVVAVDGGPFPTSAAPPRPTATITSLLTHTQTILATQLSTVIVTKGSYPTTIVMTVTTTSAITVVETLTPPGRDVVVEGTPTTVTVTDTSMSVSVETEMATVKETVLPETRPYDDGSWKTTYWYTVDTPAPTPTPAAQEVSSAPPSPSSTPEAAVPEVDDGSWGRWAGRTGGWQGQT